MVAAAERVVPTFHAGSLNVRQFAIEHGLVDRPRTLLWLTRMHVIPASMHASQIWGTWYMKEGAEMNCPLQTDHPCFLRVLGVKRTTCNWTVTFTQVWFGYRHLLLQLSCPCRQGSDKADRAVSIIPGVNYWTPAVLTEFGGLQRSEVYEQSVHNGSVVNVKEFAVDMRTQLCRVWNG
eukprot:1161348-Pelagomonas_calceolata.AAC.13